MGVGLMIFGWALMESPWMHVRVNQEDAKNRGVFVFSIPVPFNMARWIFRTFGSYMPQEVKAEEVLEILDQAESSIRKGNPFQVQVEDDKCGSRVDVFIN